MGAIDITLELYQYKIKLMEFVSHVVCFDMLSFAIATFRYTAYVNEFKRVKFDIYIYIYQIDGIVNGYLATGHMWVK